MKVAVLWSHPSGYLSASLQALQTHGCEVFLSAYQPDYAAPFSESLLEWLADENKVIWSSSDVVVPELIERLNQYRPDMIICSGWANAKYLDVCRHFRKRSVLVISFDNQWSGSMRQQLGRLWAKANLLPLFDFAFVPGERQLQTALKLGFNVKQVIFGLYAPDSPSFELNCPNEFNDRYRRFIFVGRLVDQKGVADLAAAYRWYRQKHERPWPLIVAGTGPLSCLLDGIQGVEMLGFVQPRDLPELLQTSRCMLVPSISEPWGVQISEAATAGLPIIATSSCGSAVHLIKSCFNGYVVEPGDVIGLVDAMLAITTNRDLETFSSNSVKLSGQYTPEMFAQNLLYAYKSSALGKKDLW